MYAKNEIGFTELVDRREMLRVKVKSLAAEARIIRIEERKTHGQLRNELHAHRVVKVRRAARSAHLSYGFIRGRTLGQMERTARTAPDWKDIKRLCREYGSRGYNGPPEAP
jgi:hypothetical protein